jgi:ATP-dependent DNA helicase RecQ
VEAGALTSGNTPEETDAVWEALEERAAEAALHRARAARGGGTERMLNRAGGRQR